MKYCKRLGLIVGTVGILVTSLSAGAVVVSPPDSFSGVTDEGIPVSCVLESHDSFFGHNYFSCHFQTESRELKAILARHGDLAKCFINSKGQLQSCDVPSLLEIQFYINTNSVRSELVACQTRVATDLSLQFLDCAEAYNPLASSSIRQTAWKTVADCSGEKWRLIVRQSLQDQLVASSNPGDITFWSRREYSLSYVDLFTRSSSTEQTPVQRNSEGGKTSFSSHRSDRGPLIFMQSLFDLKPGTRVPATFDQSNVNCTVY